jgi:hypothetical protein
MLGIEADTQVLMMMNLGVAKDLYYLVLSPCFSFVFFFFPFCSSHLEYQISYSDLAIVLHDLVILSCLNRLPIPLLVWFRENALCVSCTRMIR